MSALYNFVKVRMQDTLLRRKTNSMPLAPIKSTNGSDLHHEIEKLERLITQSLGKLKVSMQAGEAIVVRESRQAEQLAANLRTDIAMLRANLKEAEEAIAGKDLARQKLEESLNAKLKSFQDEIAKKESILAARDNEIKGYKFKIDDNATKISELELKNMKTKEEAASNAKRAKDLAEKTLTLEAQLKKTDELASYQESTIQELKNELAAKTQEFDCIMKDKQELLIRRNSEINDLKSQLKRLTTGISEMSSFFRQAEALADIEPQDLSARAQNDTTSKIEEKIEAVQTQIVTTDIAPTAVREIVAPEIFKRIVAELREATNMMDRLAALIMERQIKALGESVENFPRTRLSELLECLAKDISGEDRQIDFRQRCTQDAQISLN